MSSKLGTLTLDLVAKIGQFVEPMKQAERTAKDSSKNISTSFAATGTAASSASLMIGKLVASIGGLISIGTAIQKIDAYQGLENRLKLVTKSQEQLNTAMDSTFGIAQRTRSSWDATVQVYQRFSQNAASLNISMKQTAALTETVSKAVALSGASAGASEAALTQFGQALASGVLRGDEFNSIMEQTPGLSQALATGLGVSIGKLRTMAGEGKLTGDVLITALTKAKPAVDALFAKTDGTIGQSFGYLSNELTRFVGEANKGSGASIALSESIKFVADNLNLIADGAIVAGIGYITAAITTKTIAIQADIVAIIERRAAMTAEAAAQVELLGIESLRARQSLALAASELGLARAEYNAALSAEARAIAIQRLTAAEVAHAIAAKGSTSATAAYSAASLAGISTGRTLLGLLGGPVGLGVTVASLAAGYLLFKDSTDQSTVSLETNGKTAKQVTEEYVKLNAAQRENARYQNADNIKKESDAMAYARSNLIRYGETLLDHRGLTEQTRLEVGRLFGEYQKTGNLDAFTAGIKNVSGLKDDDKRKTIELVAEESKHKEEVARLNGVQDIYIKNAKAAKAADDEQTTAKKQLTQATKDLIDASNKDIAKVQRGIAMAKMGGTDESIALYEQYRAKAGAVDPTTNKLFPAVYAQYVKEYQALKQQNVAINDRNDSQSAYLQKLKDEQKILEVNSKVRANAAKYNFAGLESKYNLLPGLLSATNMQESKGNSDAIGPMTKYGTAKGGFQMLDTTAKRWGLVGQEVFNTGKSAEAAAKYFEFLYKKYGDWEKVISAYHAGEGNVDNGTGIGPVNRQYVKNIKKYVTGANAGKLSGDFTAEDFMKSEEELIKTIQETANKRKDIANEVAKYEEQRRFELNKKLEEIDKAGFDTKVAADLKKKQTDIANADIEAYQDAQNQKLAAFAAFKTSEEQLLIQSYFYKEREVQRDLSLTKDEKSKATALLREQLDNERALLTIAREQRILESRQFYMRETEAMMQRYYLEREQILKTANMPEAERKQKLDANAKDQFRALNEAQNRIGSYQNQSAAALLQAKSPYAYQQWDMQNQYSSAMGGLNDANANIVAGINAQDANGNYINDVETRNQMLLEADKAFREAKLALNAQYDKQEADMRMQWGQNYIASTADVFKQVLGENSAAYQAMFAMQKAMAIANVLMNAKTTYSNVYDSASKIPVIGPYVAPVMAGSAVALQMAQAAMIGSVSFNPQGFYSGGYTGAGGKYEYAGPAHKGEVIFSQEDVARMGGVGNTEALRKGGLDALASQNNIANQLNQVSNVTNSQSQNHIRIINVDDPNKIPEALGSQSGEKAIINVLSRNSSQVRRLLGV